MARDPSCLSWSAAPWRCDCPPDHLTALPGPGTVVRLGAGPERPPDRPDRQAGARRDRPGRRERGRLRSDTFPPTSSSTTVSAMEPSIFRKFCRIARDKGGINIAPGKEALVSARVAKRQRALGIPTPRNYLRYLEDDETGTEIIHFLDVISTNFTSFFREADHFDRLTQHVKTLIARGQRRIRLWSAACSSGEEPYSMAMSVLGLVESTDVDLRILATDLSTAVLDRARLATYKRERIEPLKRHQRLSFFDRHGHRTAPDTSYTVKPKVRDLVVFKRLNLAAPPLPMRGPLDMVFCRNVMIYFAPPTRQALIDEIERLLGPGGLLAVGHAETLGSIRHGLEPIGAALYRKPDGGPRRCSRRGSGGRE